MKDIGIPGLALRHHPGRPDRIRQRVWRRRSLGHAVTAQTPFWLASLAKPVTALAIMQLVEAGKVDLDAP